MPKVLVAQTFTKHTYFLYIKRVKVILMLKSLSKTRSKSNLLTIHMKFVLLVVIGVLLYNSNDARFFISDQLNNASEMIRPDAQLNFRY